MGEHQQQAAVLMLTVTRPVSNFKCESYPRPETGTSFPPWLQSQPTSPLSTGTQAASRGQSGAMRLRFIVNGPLIDHITANPAKKLLYGLISEGSDELIL